MTGIKRTTPSRAGLAIGICLGLLLIGPASGQSRSEDERGRVELEPTVITGSNLPGETDAGSTHVTVIPGETIREGASASATEALRSVEGLHIDEAGGRGSVSSVYLRGGDPNHTVVLIDGIKVNDPTNSRGGSFDFSTLNADEIDRIEVVRGSLSSVYGSDAISGVINILTRRGETKPEIRLDGSAGSFGYHRELLDASGRTGRLDYALSGSRLDNGEPVEGSAFVNGTGRGNIGVRLGRDTEFRSVFRYATSRMEAYPDDSGGPEYAVIRKSDHRTADERTAGADLVHNLAPALTATGHFEYFDRDERIDSPGVAPGIRDPAGIPPYEADQRFRRYRADSRVLWSMTDWLQMTAGGEFQSEDGESDGALEGQGQTIPTRFEMERRLWACFAEGRILPFENLALEAGIRSDHPEGFDARYSPRAGFAYSVSATGTRLTANWGRGFKLPSFFALSHPIVGNAGLEPEISRSAEAGVKQTFFENRISIEATYFNNRVEEAIDFEEGPPPRLVNRRGTTAHGLEVRGSAGLRPRITLSPHLTYTETDILGTSEELRNRPKWRGGGAIRWQPATPAVFVLDVLYVGTVPDSSIPTGDRTLSPYTLVNISGTWTPITHWEFYLSLRNLLDADYEEAVGFPSPGFQVRGGLRASL